MTSWEQNAANPDGMKILWISDTKAHAVAKSEEHQRLIYDNMLEYARSVARPSTQIDVNFVEDNAGEAFAPWSRYPRALLAVEVVERVRQAERDGYDAVFPGMCFGEFFLDDARQAVSIPVAGAAESAMMVAQLLGRKFAVVTTFQRFERPIQERLRHHGWEDRAIARPVRYFSPELSKEMVESYCGRPERLIEEFDELAQECVREGADVVICGCNPLGATLSKVGYREVAGTGVPVVTALSSQIKQAEMMVDLRRSLGLTKSEGLSSPYMSTPPEIMADLAAHGVGVTPSHGHDAAPYSTHQSNVAKDLLQKVA